MLPNDESYSETYRNFLDDTPKKDDNLNYINSYYTLEKSNIYHELIKNGYFLLEKYNKKIIDIIKKGFKEFENVYEH